MESGRAVRAERNNASLLPLRMLHCPIRLHLQNTGSEGTKEFQDADHRHQTKHKALLSVGLCVTELSKLASKPTTPMSRTGSRHMPRPSSPLRAGCSKAKLAQVLTLRGLGSAEICWLKAPTLKHEKDLHSKAHWHFLTVLRLPCCVKFLCQHSKAGEVSNLPSFDLVNTKKGRKDQACTGS